MTGRVATRAATDRSQAAAPADAALLPGPVLDRLMPFHLWLCPAGRLRRTGPTLGKLLGGAPVTGRHWCELFEMRRPRLAGTGDDLARHHGTTVLLAPRALPAQSLRGLLVALDTAGDVLLDLSPGIGIVDLVDRHGLSARDFAASDPTIEMLYLIEAQSLIRDELRRLGNRLASAQRTAESQAVTDALTGLGNRRAMEQAARTCGGSRADEPFAVLQIDLDHFKAVNDSLGHAAGDHVLRQVAAILREETRAGDLVIRTGGDEFLVICRDCDDPDRLEVIARRIIRRIGQPIPWMSRHCTIGASVGAALSTRYPVPDLNRMMADADAALYAGKHAGRGCFRLCAGPATQPPDAPEPPPATGA